MSIGVGMARRHFHRNEHAGDEPSPPLGREEHGFIRGQLILSSFSPGALNNSFRTCSVGAKRDSATLAKATEAMLKIWRRPGSMRVTVAGMRTSSKAR